MAVSFIKRAINRRRVAEKILAIERFSEPTNKDNPIIPVKVNVTSCMADTKDTASTLAG